MSILDLIARYGLNKNGHSHFAPSAAHAWLVCLGYILANIEEPDDAGIDAARGTVAHKIAEGWLKSGRKPVHLLGQKRSASAGGERYTFDVDEVMLGHIEKYVDWCLATEGDHYFETRVDLSHIMPIPGQGGTADFFAVRRRHFSIKDLKYGVAEKVFARQNPQCLLYAAGVFEAWDWLYDFETIEICICQPRLDHFDSWTCTRAELLEFVEFARTRAALAWTENALRTPDPEACRYCKAKDNCSARQRQIAAVIDASFDDLDSVVDAYDYEQSEAKSLEVRDVVFGKRGWPSATRELASTEYLVGVYRWRKSVEGFFKGAYEELQRRCARGEKVPGMKRVYGRGSRRWADDELAQWLLTDNGLDESHVVETKTISVAKAEELLMTTLSIGKAKAAKLIKSNVVEVPGTPTLVFDDDARPDVAETDAKVFDDLDAEGL